MAISHVLCLVFLSVLLDFHSGRVHGLHKGNEVPGQGYRQCGHYKCLGLGVVCDRGNNKCPCEPGTVGDGRIQCVNPDNACLCTIYGDPHVINFRGQFFSLPLPCSHVIADLTTPATEAVPEGCQLKITGRAWYRHGGAANSGISYENQIDIALLTPLSRFTTRVSTAGFTMKALTKESSGNQRGNQRGNQNGNQRGNQRGKRDVADEGLDISVQTDVDDAGFHRVIVPVCHVMVKYRPSDGSFSMETPVKSADRDGLCGACDDRWNQTASHNNPSQNNAIKLLLASLQHASPIDDSDTNAYPVCTTLTNVVKSCPVGKKNHAVNFCGAMLTNHKVNTCLSEKLGKEHVQDTFTECYDSVCNNGKKCNGYRQLFKNCDLPDDLNTYLNEKKFCQD